MNARFGNRCNTYKDYAVHMPDGRIYQCPLCDSILYNEIHVLIECRALEHTRAQIKISPEMTLQQKLQKYAQNEETSDKCSIARMFLGQDRKMKKMDFVRHGLALELLTEKFFQIWETKLGITNLRKHPFY